MTSYPHPHPPTSPSSSPPPNHEKRRGKKTYLLLNQALRRSGLIIPNRKQVRPSLQRLEPDAQPEDHGVESADHGHVPGELEPAARHGQDDGGDGEEEGHEY